MSVSIPGSFEILIPGAEFLPGRAVGESPLDALGPNQSYLFGSYQSMVGSVIAPSANGWEPFQVGYSANGVWIPRPACADLRDLVVTIICHDKGDGEVKVQASSYDSGGAVDSIESSGLSGNIEHIVTLTMGNSDEDGDIKVEGRTSSGPTTNMQIYSATVHYASDAGPVDAAQASGVTLVGDHEWTADYPVTDELLSRMRRNPRKLWGDRRGLVALAASYTSDPLLSTVSGSRSGFLRGRAYLRWPCNVRWWVYATSTGGSWDVTITTNDGQTITLDATSDTVAGGVSWRVDESAHQGGWLDFQVDCIADGTHTLKVFTVAAEVIE